MTVRVVNKGADDYMGYSSDEKPTGAIIKQGAIFQEIDTGARYIWYDGSWEEDLTFIYAHSTAIAQS